MTHQQQTAFESIMGKREIARNEQFLLFPQCFHLNQIILYPFVHNFDIIYLFAAELEEPKTGIPSKGLISPLVTNTEHKDFKLTVQNGSCMCLQIVGEYVSGYILFQMVDEYVSLLHALPKWEVNT